MVLSGSVNKYSLLSESFIFAKENLNLFGLLRRAILFFLSFFL